MKKNAFKSDLLLLLAAAIWGFAFVAQRIGMKYVGPFTFNGVRFLLGSLSLVPLMIFLKDDNADRGKSYRNAAKLGIIAGIILFIAVSLQQLGLMQTTAGKTAFITGLYIVLVPILGLFLKHHVRINAWIGALLAVFGLYFLCVTNTFSITKYDLLILTCAFFFAVHILLIDNFISKINAVKLSFFQFLTCAILSLAIAVFTEEITLSGLFQAAVPILYGGIASVGVAYTLQVVGQKNADPTSAAIILSMESLFAAVGGFLILHENLGLKGLIGCALML
ncbi:MAG: DMT family transporter, partial [Clostridiaceae bacterium]